MNLTSTCYIIDDNEIDVFMLERALESIESQCLFEKFSNGRDALEALHASVRRQTALPKYVLLDLNMPICDGWEFLEAAQSVPDIQNCRIIIVSSTNNDAEQDRARRHPLVSDFIAKPVTSEGLSEVLLP